MIMNYENIQVELPYEILQIEDLNFKAEINEHHTFNIKALIDENNVDKYLNEDTENKQIKLIINNNIIYVGKIIELKISCINHLSYLSIKSISYSYNSDIKRNNHAFIDLKSTYENVINETLSKYKNYIFKDNITDGKSIDNLIVQYEETDFEFLKRLASHFKSVLVVDSGSDVIRFHFGVETISNNYVLENSFNEIENKFDFFNTMQSITKDCLYEQNFIGWKLDNKEYFPLGTEFTYYGQKVCVYKVEMKIKKGEIIYTYELKFLKGIITEYKINHKLKGASLEGIVKNVKNNEMQIHFCINDNYKDDASNKWFDYCRETSNFYVMPMVGSKVHITFFTGDERKVNVTNAIRSAGSNAKYYNKISNPSNKSYSTENGQELLMSPDMIQIAQDDGKSIQVTLSSNGSVSISGSNINLSASKKAEVGSKAPFNAKKNPVKPKSISISAKNCVTITRSVGSSVNPSEVIQLKEENNIKGIAKLGR
ncbi:hypothetical protein [uncultured Clostridium sp.]|uniref:hypothetical protein n=1 Tax=uncultured Clostridium sp. TaxID=59620 RepID=UPI0028E9508F|nr:hypothetical protein [uncultured Clostridium sp.]